MSRGPSCTICAAPAALADDPPSRSMETMSACTQMRESAPPRLCLCDVHRAGGLAASSTSRAVVE
eukprot:scaffold27137_cov121-Isochrysis_galbana.AAC.11